MLKRKFAALSTLVLLAAAVAVGSISADVAIALEEKASVVLLCAMYIPVIVFMALVVFRDIARELLDPQWASHN